MCSSRVCSICRLAAGESALHLAKISPVTVRLWSQHIFHKPIDKNGLMCFGCLAHTVDNVMMKMPTKRAPTDDFADSENTLQKETGQSNASTAKTCDGADSREARIVESVCFECREISRLCVCPYTKETTKVIVNKKKKRVLGPKDANTDSPPDNKMLISPEKIKKEMERSPSPELPPPPPPPPPNIQIPGIWELMSEREEPSSDKEDLSSVYKPDSSDSSESSDAEEEVFTTDMSASEDSSSAEVASRRHKAKIKSRLFKKLRHPKKKKKKRRRHHENNNNHKKGLICVHCCVTCETAALLGKHTKNVSCKVCKINFACRTHLNIHDNEQNVWCKHCKSKMHGVEAQLNHETQNVCQICDKSFKCRQGLSIHMGRSVTCKEMTNRAEEIPRGPSKVHPCTKCFGKFDKYEKLAEHKSRKTCNCGRNFHCESEFAIHASCCENGQEVEAPPKAPRYQICSGCALKFMDVESLQKHRQQPGEKVCKKCGQIFECVRQQKDHLELCVTEELDEEEEEEPPLCEHCGKNYKSGAKHLRTPTCDICGQKFACGGQYKQHKKTCTQKFPCGTCDDKFSDEEALRVHAEQKWDCPACDFHVSCPNQSKEHDCVQSPASPAEPQVSDVVPCKFCAILCPSEEALRSHSLLSNCPRCGFWQSCETMRARHLDHCMYEPLSGVQQCPMCTKVFQDAAFLGTHVQVEHKQVVVSQVQTFECQVCGKAFAGAAKLDAHRVRRHPQHFTESDESTLEDSYPPTKVRRLDANLQQFLYK